MTILTSQRFFKFAPLPIICVHLAFPSTRSHRLVWISVTVLNWVANIWWPAAAFIGSFYKLHIVCPRWPAGSLTVLLLLTHTVLILGTHLFYFRGVGQGQSPLCCPCWRPLLYTGTNWPLATLTHTRIHTHICTCIHTRKLLPNPCWVNDDGVMRDRVGVNEIEREEKRLVLETKPWKKGGR